MSKSDKKASQDQEHIDNELKNSKVSQSGTAKSHGEILKQQIIEGQETYDKKPVSILLSSLTAGLEIGFSYLLICVLFYFLNGKVSEDTQIKALALVYPVGFIMIILGQSILYTEQTSLLTLPVLNKKRSLGSLLRLWGLVILGNLIGGYLISFLLVWFGPRLGAFDLETVEKIAIHVTQYSGLVILVSSILAGWLMGMLSWLVAASKDTLSRIFIIFLITSILSFVGLHHSIVGNVEVFAGLISSPAITLVDYLKFIGLALFGNAVGGAVFVALLKYRAFVYDVKG